MRENPIKRKLAAGGSVVGTMFMEFATDGIGRIAAAAGAEFGVFDREHSDWDHETIKRLMATTRPTQMTPLVRVPALDYNQISRALDAGAMGIVAPFVDSAEQAKHVVDCVRYPPEGRRGVAFNIAHDDYTGGSPAEKMAHFNRETLVVVQIESSRGLEDVERIASVEGVDAVWIGQFDLTASLGIPGQFDNPQYHEAVARILRACEQGGKAAGYGTLFLDELVRRRDQGFRFLVYTADIWIYQRALRDGLRTIRDRPKETKQA